MSDHVDVCGQVGAGDSSSITLPRFTALISERQARLNRWRHNVVSCMSMPFRMLGRCAPAGSFGILMYHRVCPLPKNRFPPTYNVSPQRFGKQLDWLLKHGYKAWPLDRIVAAKTAGEKIDDNVFAVTFDDGYANNLVYALPILEELRVPATLFLATAYIDSDVPFPFDNWIEQPDPSIPEDTWKPMTLSQCHQFHDSPLIEFGCHTHTHADFRNQVDLLSQEIRQCNAILQSEFGVKSPPFSFPYGTSKLGFATKEMAETARAAGCSCALRVDNELVADEEDLFFMPRFDVAPGGSGASIASKLDGWAECIRSTLRKIRSRKIRSRTVRSARGRR